MTSVRRASGPPARIRLAVASRITLSPLGVPFGQADASAVPRSMLTRVISSSTVTSPLPSPAHAGWTASASHRHQSKMRVAGAGPRIAALVDTVHRQAGADCRSCIHRRAGTYAVLGCTTNTYRLQAYGLQTNLGRLRGGDEVSAPRCVVRTRRRRCREQRRHRSSTSTGSRGIDDPLV